tara:strand:- start:57 stop:392 length:336 start_codon:yes stop_codon:yes gene_type:complete
MSFFGFIRDRIREKRWNAYCNRKTKEAESFMNENGLKYGNTYKGRHFLGEVYEGKLIEVWDGYAAFELKDGSTVSDIYDYSLVSPEKEPPESNYRTLQDELNIKLKTKKPC